VSVTPDEDGDVDVLLIDDDATFREIYQASLERDGYRVATAESGERGIELAVRLRPSLIVLDIVLPRWDGFTVHQELAARTETTGIPVLLMTNRDDPATIRRGLAMGAQDVLLKIHTPPRALAAYLAEHLR
jgi:DNA-binding response OmpR family regulator